jgi:signal transduction histidine kinase/DNA-binding response OmpR family regulator/CHASE3 domain sensor protein/HAMP domain-containing protein
MDNNSHLNATSVKRQLQVVFAVSILMLLISSFASYYSNQKLITTTHLVNHTNDVIIHADSILSLMKDAETGQRGYLLTQDPIFLQPYNGAPDKVNICFNQLRELTGDNPVQQNNLNKLKPLIDERFSAMERVLAKEDSSSTQGQKLTVIANNYQDMLRGKKIMDDIRQVLRDMKTEENRLLALRTDEQNSYVKNTPVLIIIAAIVAVLVSLLSYFRINKDLEQRIAKQKEEQEIYRRTSERITAMEEVTRKIASGDYAVRSYDEEKDNLGKIAVALNEMANALQKNFEELEKRDWLQKGSINLANAVRGERFVKIVAEKIVSSLAEYIKAPVGTLYLADNDMNLKFAGGYAVKNVTNFFEHGQGLIGQAVKDNKLTVVSNVPNDFAKIISATGSALPTHVMILPLKHGEETVGALEFGLLHAPDEDGKNFLLANAEAIAITLTSAINYEKMQDLLEETQAQAEELQTQHNELEGMNVELEAQAEKLQASEEELKVQQEELLEANTELEEKARLLEEKNYEIVEKNKEVQRKAEELAISTKYKSEFLANMSHELRTPLNSILLLSRLLSENNETNLTADQVEYAKVIQSSGNGLLSLIDEILDLSKIEAGKMQLETEVVAVNSIAENMRSLFAPVAKEKGIEFKIEKDNDVPVTLQTDSQRLEQILKNLISNALKFTSKGYVSLRISNDKMHKGIMCFEVKDTGIGIPEDKQALIFEAFQQADGSTRRKFGGTGLGLSISRSLIGLLGGKMTLHSKPGQGSSFTISVPISKEYMPEEMEVVEDLVIEHADEAIIPVEHAKPEYTAKLIPENIPDDRSNITAKDKAILIVEDDTNFAKPLLEYTRKQGYKGIVAVRGDEGIELARQYKPAGILLDIELPVKNGWEVMEELKADPQVRHIPVHIMSSHSLKKESIMKGAVDFIDKPFAMDQMQEIFRKLEHILDRDAKKVLIVEENPKHAKALAYFLESFNINSEIKNSINDSVRALSGGVDCVILDMGVPDQKSYDMLEQVKKTPGLEHLPIIIFTGKSLSMAEEHRIKKYADSIVVKTAHSYQRMLDEISIFLHLMEDKKNKKDDNNYKKLGALNDVLNGKTVLIVDDDVRNIFSLTRALENYKMNIVTAIDGKEALTKLNENKNIDVVLLDMMMPEMDGYETATRIRQNREWKNLPVIAVTAKAMVGDRDKCIKAGASDYVTKPVDIDQLLSLLRVWLYERV